MITFRRSLAIFFLAGLVVPLVFRAVNGLIRKSENVDVHFVVEKLMLLLWPASLITLPASPDPAFENKLFLISLALNVIFYIALGALFWLGLNRHFSFFGVAVILLVSIWWWLLTQ